MAITYKISELGLHKVVEILNDGEVIGRHKFLAKEISTAANNGVIELKDTFTQEVLFSGSTSSFVNSNGDAFGETTSEAVNSINTTLDKVKVSIEELDGFEIVSGGVDLTEYAKKTYVDSNISTVSTSLSTLEENVNNTFDTVEQYADRSTKGIVYQFNNDGVRCNPGMSVTFTTTDTGVVKFFVPEITAQLDTSAAVEAVLSTADPGTGVSYNGENSIDARQYFDSTAKNDEETFTEDEYICYVPNVITSTIVVGNSISYELTLDPNTEYTFYLWARTTILGVNASPRIVFNQGIKVQV
jgi:hypothetical protein